jgi:AcrR family transcriptional regulator
LPKATPRVPSLRELAARYSPIKRRTIETALALFAQHGVGGTSLQMIADELGVTKAAVYHQFPVKEAIAQAVIEVELSSIEEALERAESIEPVATSREVLLEAVVDIVVANRGSLSTLQSDPVLFRMLNEYEPSLRMWLRLFGLLLGDDVDDRLRVRASVVAAAMGSDVYPCVIGRDDRTVRDELLVITRNLLFENQ